MKRANLFYIGLIILLLLVLTIKFFNLNAVIGDFFTEWILKLGYVGLFISVFLIEFLPQPFISSLLPLTLGIFIGLNLGYMLALTFLSSILADYSAYFVGLFFGESIVESLIEKKDFRKSMQWFEKYGKKSMALLALTPLPYFPIVGGIFKMKFSEFTLYATFPRMINLLITSFILIKLI